MASPIVGEWLLPEGNRIVVTGGRDYADEDLVFIVLDRLHAETPFALLVHGACGWDLSKPESWEIDRLRGADGLSDKWARSRGVPLARSPADWSKGPSGGPRRNASMLDTYKPGRVLAFPGDRGTKNCVREARLRRIPVEHAAHDGADAADALAKDLRANDDVRRPPHDKEKRNGTD